MSGFRRGEAGGSRGRDKGKDGLSQNYYNQVFVTLSDYVPFLLNSNIIKSKSAIIKYHK